MLATGLERLLALGILLGVIAFAYESIIALIQMDWSTTETFYELIYRSLLLVISVELIRTLVTHDLMAVLELLAFVGRPEDAQAGIGTHRHSPGRRRLWRAPRCAPVLPSPTGATPRRN